jgi:hypothetical protein
MGGMRGLLPRAWPTMAAALIVAALIPGAGNAQSNALRQDCRADLKAHCRSYKPGSKDALACLRQHEARLTAACREAVRAGRSHRPATPPPQQTAASPPSPPPAPPPPVAPALMSTPAPAAIVSMPPPPAQLPGPRPPQHPIAAEAPPPKTAAPPPVHRPGPMAKKNTTWLGACKRDLARICPGIRNDMSRALACLAAHRRALEPRCRVALKLTEKRP